MSFSATISIIGVNPYVAPPDHILAVIFESAKRDKSPIPVRGTIDGEAFTQTLVKHKGVWRLYINGLMREAAGVKVGDRVTIQLRFDPRPREVPMNPKLQEALARDSEAEQAFAAWPPSRQAEVNRYLSSLKSDESVARNVERVLQQLPGPATWSAMSLMSFSNSDDKR